jgi:hypothetical protein
MIYNPRDISFKYILYLVNILAVFTLGLQANTWPFAVSKMILETNFKLPGFNI